MENSLVPLFMTTYDNNGNTIDKYQMSIKYISKKLIGYFDFAENTLYSGLSQWFSISFKNSIASVSKYAFLRFSLSSDLEFALPIQCNSTSIQPFNESGIFFFLENKQSLFISNVMQFMPSITYQMSCKMKTSLSKNTLAISPSVSIQLNHNASLNNSLVSTIYSVVVDNAPITVNLA